MSCRTQKWREMSTVGLWILLLQCLSYTQGEIYLSQRMKIVTTFSSSLNTVCIVPLGAKPKVAVKIELMVLSTRSNDIISAGGVTIRNKLLSPVHSDHTLTMQHVVDDDTVHILKVLLDGNEVEFIQSRKYDWSNTYEFHHIALSLKGMADVTPCANPTDPPITTTSTTTTTTTTTPPPPTTTLPTTTTTTTTEAVATMPLSEAETTYVAPPEESEDHTTAPPSEAPGEDVLLNLGNTNEIPETYPNTNLSLLETYEVADAEPEDPAKEDEEPWWDFVYILGDFKRIPILILLIIVFCVGLGIGSVTTILCEQYCSCCAEDEENNKNSDFDGEFRHFSRTDFMRPSANATFVGTVDHTGRLSKENISPPINPTGSRSPTSDTYSSPYQARERYLSSNTDETLPLNIPLPQENQLLKNGSYNQYKYKDTYQ